MNRILALLAFVCCVLGMSAEQWAQVNTSVAHVRTAKGHSQELCTQEYMGMPVKVLEKDGNWSRVETTDGYNGWVTSNALAYKTQAELDAWKQQPRMVVTSLGEIESYNTPTATDPRSVVTDLVPNDIVVSGEKVENGRLLIILPDGQRAWADASAFTPIREWATQEFDSERLLDYAYDMMGKPYTWGGNSSKGLDCSGLSKNSYLRMGIFLLRDASMQAKTGKQLDKDNWQAFEQGDLLFFGSKQTGRVTHVGIYDKDGIFIHSNGLTQRVSLNSMDPNSPDYPNYTTLGAVRIHGMEDTPGIVKAINHPWLF